MHGHPQQRFLNNVIKLQNPLFQFFIILVYSFILNGCAFSEYKAQPISIKSSADTFNNRSIDDPAFHQFLAQQTDQKIEHPIKNWGLATLIHTAHYFHPDLNVAREELNAAMLSESNAHRRPLPTVNASLSRSDQANGDINPFAYHFSIDLPINTANKQAIRISHFTHLSNVAKLNIAQTAWKIRQQVTSIFTLLHQHYLTADIVEAEVEAQMKVVNLIQKRVQYGEASNIDLSHAQRQLSLFKAAQHAHKEQLLSLKAQLAQSLGLPLKIVDHMTFDFAELSTPLTETSTLPSIDESTAQETALLNRIDIRLGLENYAIAENQLKLEIAKQYPDISISPGYSYEFGDKVWSLGFSSLMSLIEKNKANIALSEQLRTVEKAKFEQLQANVIAEVSAQNALYQSALRSLEDQHHLYIEHTQHFEQLKRQFNAGMIDRLTLTSAHLALLGAKKNVISAVHALNLAKNNFENALQQPL